MFNALKCVKMLEDVGFSREQAETSIRILVETMEDTLATKQDMKDLTLSTRQDMKDFRQEFKQDIKSLEAKIENLGLKMTIRMGTMLAASIAILTAIQKLV